MKTSVRERILETASDLFYEKGYNLTGINEIIEKAGVAKASLYSHFRSKEDICLAYLVRMDGILVNDLRAFLKEKPKGKKGILAIFDFLTQFYQQEGFRGCWCLNTISEIPRDNVKIKAEIFKQKKAFMRLLEEIVSENLPEAEQQKVERISRRIYLLYEGAISESQLQDDHWPIAEAKEMAEGMIWKHSFCK